MQMLLREHYYCNGCSVQLSSCYLCGETIRDGDYYVSKLEFIISGDINKLILVLGREDNEQQQLVIKEKIKNKQKLLDSYREIFCGKTSKQILDIDLIEHFNQNRECFFFH
jgi:recombinational DNA repair protein (RecF pathway)